MKLIGALALVLASAGMGLAEALRLRRRARLTADLAAGLENLGGAEFGEIWAAALELLDLSDPARAALLNLGGSLGRYGAAEQAAAISACEAELRREAQNAAEEARVMGKLRAGLAAGGGIILAIVLY